MGADAKRVTIGSGEDVLRVLEDLRRDHQPRLLERDGEDVAAVIDIQDLHKVLHRGPSDEQVREAFEAVGAWRDVDATELKRSIREGRKRGSRPASRPA